MLTRYNENSQIGKVDRENGIIYGVSVITGDREALGHETFVDETMVDQVVERGQSFGDVGLKARFDHPSACYKSIGTAIGRFKNFRKDGLQARADLHLLDSAASSPDGDLRTHVLDLAAEDPDIFATSIVFTQGEPVQFDPKDHPDKDENDAFFFPHARIKELHACDVVDEGAANDGLFGRPNYLAEQAEKWASEHKDILEPILFKIFEKYQNQKNMEGKETKETKTTFQDALEGLKNTYNGILEKWNLKKDDTTEENEEAEEEAGSEEENKALEAANAEIEALKAANQELTENNESLSNDIKELSEKIEDLSSLKLGKPIEATSTEEKDNTYKETKEDKKQKKFASLLEAREEFIKQKGY